MSRKLLYFVSVFLVLIAVSCGTEHKTEYTYFGGKIINPKSNIVVLYSKDKVIDTFYLNNKDRFLGKIENANEGLYYFTHGNENQHIYIEPKDSLMLRLNTWDFDESLVFAGKGAERNNILIDCFLEDEKDKNIFYKYNKLEPAAIKNKVDSLTKLKLDTYEDYLKNHPNETEGFKEVLKVAILYPMYSRLERYPIIYARYSADKKFPIVTNNFYDFRKSINKDIDSLMYFPPYSRYVRNFLYNEAYNLGHPPMTEGFKSDFTFDLMNVISDKISCEQTKNAFLRQTIVSHFYNKLENEDYGSTLDKYFELSSNKNDQEFVQKLINDSKKIAINDRITNFELYDYSNAKHRIADILDRKNLFVFFWNSENVSEAYLTSRMKFLIKTYPNIDFIQINIDGKKSKRVEKIDIKNQFYIDGQSSAHQFLTSKTPRSIILNDKGIVLNSNISISSRSLNNYLKELNRN